MKILHLTLKKKWFDMILSGEKREEYREIKPYWMDRLNNVSFTHIRFVNGYGKDKPWLLINWRGMYQGKGLCLWGAPPGKSVYILELGAIVDSGNIKPTFIVAPAVPEGKRRVSRI